MTQNPPTKLSINSHRDLIVWQKAMDLVVSVYHETETFPGSEMYGLTRQIRRAAASIPANIAEGQGRRFRKEFLSYLANARGSLWELDSHFELAARLGFLEPKLHSRLQIPNGRSRSNLEWTHEISGQFFPSLTLASRI